MADSTQPSPDADVPEPQVTAASAAPEGTDGTGRAEADGAEARADTTGHAGTEAETDTIGTDDDAPTGPSSTRVGWVVAAFLFFWPLAIPALVLSMRTAEANGTGSFRRARKSSVHTLDFALGAVTTGVVGLVALAIGIVAAPTYASSLPPGVVAAARSFVPPALAGPLGIGTPDGGVAPTSTAAPSGDPYADDPYAEDPYGGDLSAQDPYAQDPYGDDQSAEDAGEGGYGEDPADGTDTGTSPEDGGAADPGPDTTATSGAEIPDLEVGDCFDTSATSGQSTLYRIPVVSCTTAHGGEIYAETTADDSLAKDGEAPTQQALWDAADAYCYPQFARFVGLRWARSELLYWPIAPSEESWAEGDRRILCVVESETPVTGTLRDAER
ncbi:septum formation family protein [Promicromonospora sp. MS192]|uniref:septum formation family protein n=1 Tax=Promicromonospora sp. MS192 TaxID=3412684 RepID=UPI003C2C98C5